jgi:hypothetical protein
MARPGDAYVPRFARRARPMTTLSPNAKDEGSRLVAPGIAARQRRPRRRPFELRTGEDAVKRALPSSILALFLVAGAAIAQDRSQATTPPGAGPSGREPPPQAYDDCQGRKAGDAVQHATPEGKVAAICQESPKGLVARPDRRRETSGPGGSDARPSGHPAPRGAVDGTRERRYSLEQATSDRAQLNTIAFDGLAFLTGDFGYDTFLPPGKVSDYFGFQYLRDIDAQEAGHSTSFLTRIAGNVLTILDDVQRARLIALAREQEADIRRFAEMRLPLIKAFRLNLEGKVPAGSAGLSRDAVMRHSADLYVIDGQLSYRRAQVMAGVLRSLSEQQKAAWSRLRFGDSGTWPDRVLPFDRRSMSHDADVAVMTYASEMFSWYAGSVEADTYFCPERHGMYFGGFGMKTAPAMGKRDHAISTTLTGDSGERFLAALSDAQRRQVTSLIDLQRPALHEIVRVRRAIAVELRRFLKGETADREVVLSMSRRYGELDGELSYLYAVAFARVGQTLSGPQKQALAGMRSSDSAGPNGPFLYSTPVAAPRIGSTDAFFGARS